MYHGYRDLPDLKEPDDGHEHCDHPITRLLRPPGTTLCRCCWCGRPIKVVIDLAEHGPLAQP